MNEAILLVMADAFDADAERADAAQAEAGSPAIREYHRGQRNAYAHAAQRLRGIYQRTPAPPSAREAAETLIGEPR